MCIATLISGAFAFGAFAKELQVIGHYFCCEALVAALVCPLAGAEFAFNVDLAAFVDEFFHYVCIVAPHHNAVPFGVFSEFAASVSVSFCCCEAEGGYFNVA